MPRVLIVDDSRTVRMDLDEAFGSIGFQRALASTLAEARAALSAGSFDLLVLDVMLPDGDGIDFLGQLRASAADLPPVMLLSNEREVGHRIRGLVQGADEYVGKPYDVDYVLARAREIVARKRPAAKRASEAGAREVRVLAVDDSPTFLHALTSAFEDVSWHVRTARSGEEALLRLSEDAYDCVVLDLTMPGLSGVDTLVRLRALPAGRDVPVVVLTAADEASRAIEALEKGADDFVGKSADMAVLHARIRALLRRRRLERENARLAEERARAKVEEAQANAARELAALRARLLADLEAKNAEIEREGVYKARFLSSVSHELRTPLHAILGCAELLARDEALPASQRARVDTVLHSGRHLLAIVNDILDLSKVTSGRMQLRSEWTPPAPIFAAARTVAEQLAAQKGVRLSMDLPPCLPDVWADSVRLTQVLCNLLSNAVKFTPAGRAVRLVGRLEGDTLALVVEDEGIGISPQDLPRLFREFEQVVHEGERPQGTGLGLVLSRRLVELHGGTLTATSTLGAGSTFTVRLPIVRPASEGAPRHVVIEGADAAAANLCAAHLRARGLPVAICGDDETARRVASALGARDPFVAVVADGRTPLGAIVGTRALVVVAVRWAERWELATLREIVDAADAPRALGDGCAAPTCQIAAVGPLATAIAGSLDRARFAVSADGEDEGARTPALVLADTLAPDGARRLLVATPVPPDALVHQLAPEPSRA